MKRLLICAPLVLLLSGGASRAAVSFDVAVGMDVNEDTRIFLNVTNQVWHPAVATTVVRGCPYPEDDFPVIAFLSYHSHRSPSFILNLRNEGYSWSEIFFQLNVSPSVLFVGIDRDPGPPYGKAWGYWQKHYRPGARVRYRLADRDVIGLVKVQTVSRHFAAKPLAVIESQRDGRGPEVYAANRWRERHGRATWMENPGGGGHPHDSQGPRGKEGRSEGESDSGHSGHGHGHGHGQGKNHD